MYLASLYIVLVEQISKCILRRNETVYFGVPYLYYPSTVVLQYGTVLQYYIVVAIV
jgi:hypothetical protein